MKKNNLKEKTIKRPWQGTTWVWVNIVFIIFALFIIFILSIMIWGFNLNDGGDHVGFGKFLVRITNVKIIAMIVSFVVLYIFLIIGFLRGWKWAIIISIVLESWGLINALFSMGELGSFISLIFVGFNLYLSVVCLKHPFYNQNEIESKS